MKLNDFIPGPEGTSHKSPAQSAGVGVRMTTPVLKGRFIRLPGIHVRVVLLSIPTAVPNMRRPFRTRDHLPRPNPALRAGLL